MDHKEYNRKAKLVQNTTKKRKKAELYKIALNENKKKTLKYLKTTDWMFQMKNPVDSKNYISPFI